MSSRRVRYFKKEVPIANTSWATGTTTVNTIGTHKLVTGDNVSILTNKSVTQLDVIATVINTTQFTFPSDYDIGVMASGIVVVPFFRSLDSTGGKPSLTTGNSSSLSPVISSWMTGGAGTCIYNIEGSLDGLHWFVIGSAVTQPNATVMATSITINAPYLRINITTATVDAASVLTACLAS